MAAVRVRLAGKIKEFQVSLIVKKIHLLKIISFMKVRRNKPGGDV